RAVTCAPRCGRIVTSPSLSSMRSASRTEARLTPKAWARSTSRSFCPGLNSPSTMARPIRTAICAGKVAESSKVAGAGSAMVDAVAAMQPCFQPCLIECRHFILSTNEIEKVEDGMQLDQAITRAAWRGKDIQNSEEWIYRLSEQEIAEIDAALRHLKA